jgi:hypothetical protein
VRREGVEPSRHEGHWFLGPARLPLRHQRTRATDRIRTGPTTLARLRANRCTLRSHGAATAPGAHSGNPCGRPRFRPRRLTALYRSSRLEPPAGTDPAASSVPRTCSAIELRRHRSGSWTRTSVRAVQSRAGMPSTHPGPWSPLPGSNGSPASYKEAALPDELSGHGAPART